MMEQLINTSWNIEIKNKRIFIKTLNLKFHLFFLHFDLYN